MPFSTRTQPSATGTFSPSLGVVGAAIVCGVFSIGVAVAGLFGLRETFGVDLDYVEET